MVSVSIPGLMENVMKEISTKTNATAKALSSGQTAALTKAFSARACSMAQAFSQQPRVKPMLNSGATGRKLNINW